jgi:hypothetical protein
MARVLSIVAQIPRQRNIGAHVFIDESQGDFVFIQTPTLLVRDKSLISFTTLSTPRSSLFLETDQNLSGPRPSLEETTTGQEDGN